MISFPLDNFESNIGTCVAIGVFDGVHRGHQRVLSQTREAAELAGLEAVALTFDTHPLDLLAPERAPLYLCSLSQRCEWMTAPGLVSRSVVATFNREFANLTAREFVEQILVARLNAKLIRVGADFRFGKDRRGSVMDLESMGEQQGFSVQIVHALSRGGERISSTRIRTLVAEGDVEHSAVLLGRPFTLRGKVVEGKHLGRTIGYPTVNLEVVQPRQLLPANGIYAGYALLENQPIPVRAAISVGTNPTTDGGSTDRKVEAFLMDGFDDMIYGQTIDLRFVARIRDEEHYDSLAKLVEQIGRDVEQVKIVAPQMTAL